MNGIQKLIKIFAICLAVFIILNICGWIIGGITFLVSIGEGEVTSEVRTKNMQAEYYQEKISKDIKEIDIDIKSAVLHIENTEGEFSVEVDDKSDFTIREENGKLKIKETDTWFWNNERAEHITIKVPETVKLEKIDLDAGGGKTRIEGIKAERLNLDQGAGILEISNSSFDKTKINGGAGEIKVTSSKLNDLKLDAGVGKVDINGEITGESKIECGIGEVGVTLTGGEENYKITAEKGIGSIKINDQEYGNSSVYGNGNNTIRIERRNRKRKSRLLEKIFMIRNS